MASTDGQLRFGIRLKFISMLVVVAIIVTGFVALIERMRVRAAAREQIAESGSALARTVAASSSSTFASGSQAEFRDILNGLTHSGAVVYAEFLDAGGTRLAATSNKVPPSVEALPPVTADVTTLTSAEGERLHVFRASVTDRSGGMERMVGSFRLVMSEKLIQDKFRLLSAANAGLLTVTLLLATALGYVASQRLLHPILSLSDAAHRVARGDLTHRIDVERDDEIGALGEAFNAMATNLERTVRSLAASQSKLRTVVETVSSRSRTVMEQVDEQRSVIDDTYRSIDHLDSGARKITSNVETLSASSEETSSSMLEMVASMEEVSRHTDTLFDAVEETASATTEMVSSINEVDQNVVYLANFVTDTSSSMVEMSASIAEVQTNAARSYDLTLAVADAAESGMKAVRETIDGMEQIRQSVVEANSVVSRLGDRSVAIGKILNVIEDVAEQTNLLALNAAILAAQAGEHGKGFSVVAAEIRELSERTASSTRDIASLIRSVQDEVSNALKSMSAGSRLVEEGVELSHEAGRALNKILDSTSKASDMGKEIAGATREQAQGSENVTRAVGRLQELVGQINSATRQQSQGSQHIMRAVESMREVTKYVRQAMVEQRTGSGMISAAAERMIDMIHEIFQVAANQAGESEKIVATMQKVRNIADNNRSSAADMNDAVTLLNDAIRSLEDEVRKFKVRGGN